MEEITNEKCICCGRPAKKHIVFYTADKGFSTSTRTATYETTTTNYYNFEKHDGYFCTRCMADKVHVKELIISASVLVVSQVLRYITGNKGDLGALLLALGFLAGLLVIIFGIGAIPKEKGALANVAAVFPGKAIFGKEVEPRLEANRKAMLELLQKVTEEKQKSPESKKE